MPFEWLKSLIMAGLLSITQPSLAAELLVHSETALTSIGRDQLRAIFALQKAHWSDGSPIIVLRFASNTALHKSFCTQQLGVSPQQLEAVWERRVFTGQGRRPTIVQDEQEMLMEIARTPGAIGYISERIEHENVKFLTIDR